MGAVNAAAEPHGVLGLSGTAPDVGVAGYIFHGGIGWLTRAHGLASGHPNAVEFVDGTGAARRTDEHTDPDLLWAFRGGGGLGVATALEFGLVTVPDLHAGFLLWPASAAEAVIGAWAAVVSGLPPGVSSSMGMLRFPGAPVVDESLRGQRGVHLSLACCDGADAASALFDALTAAPPAAQDTFGPCDATRLGGIHLDPPVAVPAVGQGLWLNERAPAYALDILGAFGFGQDAPFAEMELRHVGSAPTGAAGALTAPPGEFVLHATGAAPEPASRARIEQASAVVTEAASPASAGYQAASFRDGRPEALASCPPATMTRLRELAARTDPDSVISRARRLY